jgi:hypothetical protein
MKLARWLMAFSLLASLAGVGCAVVGIIEFLGQIKHLSAVEHTDGELHWIDFAGGMVVHISWPGFVLLALPVLLYVVALIADRASWKSRWGWMALLGILLFGLSVTFVLLLPGLLLKASGAGPT